MTTRGQLSEEIAQRYLQDRFDREFSKVKLPVEVRGKTEHFEFDAVSDDGKVVAEVKAYTAPYHPAEMDGAMADVYRLSQVGAEVKLLFLTDPLFYMAFCRKHKALLVGMRKQGIEILSPFELANYLEEYPASGYPGSGQKRA